MRPTYSFPTPVRAGLLSVGLLFAACGDDSGGTSDGNGRDAAVNRDAGRRDASALQCEDEGEKASCTCAGNATGTKTCRSGSYSACACSIRDDAGRPVSQCKAGYYTGHFKGTYRPGAFGFGVFPSGFQVDISGEKSFVDMSVPGLAFSLTESVEGGGEVGLYKVGGGCMQGVATAVVVTQSPFVARLEGDLDCNTGAFNGTLTGYYSLIGFAGDYSFKGPLTGQFDFVSSEIQDGNWMVEEPPAASGDPAGGGEGTWDAQWTADVAPPQTSNPCDFVGPNGEHLTTPISQSDAGTTPQTDAGTTLAPGDSGTRDAG